MVKKLPVAATRSSPAVYVISYVRKCRSRLLLPPSGFHRQLFLWQTLLTDGTRFDFYISLMCVSWASCKFVGFCTAVNWLSQTKGSIDQIFGSKQWFDLDLSPWEGELSGTARRWHFWQFCWPFFAQVWSAEGSKGQQLKPLCHGDLKCSELSMEYVPCGMTTPSATPKSDFGTNVLRTIPTTIQQITNVLGDWNLCMLMAKLKKCDKLFWMTAGW